MKKLMLIGALVLALGVPTFAAEVTTFTCNNVNCPLGGVHEVTGYNENGTPIYETCGLGVGGGNGTGVGCGGQGRGMGRGRGMGCRR